MHPSIFGKSLDNLNFSDIVTFCASKPKEGLGLDYKKDLSSLPNVVKALVSFANTNGGWLIIGVDDDGNDAPKLPVIGMNYEDNFEQRINNSIISTVSPIVLPFYKECRSDDNKKAFLVVYMPQSQAAPHFMEYKGKHVLFIRVADRASGQDWEEYANGSQWEILRNRRKAGVDLRGQLLTLMKSVYEARAFTEERVKRERKRQEESNLIAALLLPTEPYFAGKHSRGAQTITILPAYPSNQVSSVADVRHMITREPVRNGITTRRAQTPDHRGYDTKIYQNGAYSFHEDDATKHYYFFGLDVYGNIMNVDPIELAKNATDDNGDKIRENYTELTLIIMSIVGALKFAHKFYSKTGLIGNLIFRAEFSGSDNCLMYFPLTAQPWPFNTDNLPQNITGDYLVQREIDTNVLSDTDSFNSFVAEVAKEILYSFNYSTIDDAALLDIIQQAAKDI